MNLNVKDFTTDISGALTSVTTLDNTFYYTSTSEPTPGASLEDNKTTTISNNGTVEITPSATYDAMKKVTATVNVPSTVATFAGYQSCYTNSGDDSEAASISDSNVLILFSDANMTSAADPSTLQSGDNVYALYLEASAGRSYGITDGLLGAGITDSALQLKVDHLLSGTDAGKICFDTRDSNYIFMDTAEVIGTKSLAYWLSQYRYN